jgi:hypothetical protein
VQKSRCEIGVDVIYGDSPFLSKKPEAEVALQIQERIETQNYRGPVSILGHAVDNRDNMVHVVEATHKENIHRFHNQFKAAAA